LAAGQLGVACILAGKTKEASDHFKHCLEISKLKLKNRKLQLDCLLCLGYISYEQEDWETSSDAFNQGYFIAKKSEDT
jgi:hypothetical protein